MIDHKIFKHKEEALKKWQQQNVYKQVNGKYVIWKFNDKRLKFTQKCDKNKNEGTLTTLPTNHDNLTKFLYIYYIFGHLHQCRVCFNQEKRIK